MTIDISSMTPQEGAALKAKHGADFAGKDVETLKAELSNLMESIESEIKQYEMEKAHPIVSFGVTYRTKAEIGGKIVIEMETEIARYLMMVIAIKTKTNVPTQIAEAIARGKAAKAAA